MTYAVKRIGAFESLLRYRDSVGRWWWVDEAHRDVLLVRREWRPWVTRLAFVDPDCPGQATVILHWGFTTLYANGGLEP